MSESILPVAVWLENQPNIGFEGGVPEWAHQLENAHKANQVCVMAHEHTAYAKAGLAGHVLTGVLWPDEDVLGQLEHGISEAMSLEAKKFILILPVRASSALWVQFLLCELPNVGAQLDELITLMQLDRDWGDLSQGLVVDQLLLADRVLSFNGDDVMAQFAEQMRALNPLAMWVHNGFISDDDVSIPIMAYSVDAPLWREPLKKDDLLAWGAHKVVYFSFSQPMNGEKIKEMLGRWRIQHGASMTRLLAVVNLQGEVSPLCMQALQYLWSDMFIDVWPEGRTPETHMWILGQGLPWDELEVELQQCIA
ncbi:hypothetical protein DTO96_100139 [Ephemeroptericola cinctiostellae]|uniref:CobW C-terminal domain-containing protein n=1 Tax=Ephemeroptericola cinctiostellae TaxID=2268024 RepID=A0A345D7U4_9BURK|nr:GTP-binding protein [Ephemeroptericola cinctiostellae]AXF84432.1 hypothetical protein DTO96_100139 [Ephemeroptericola cinctiostellae]